MVGNCLTLTMNGIEVGEWRKSANGAMAFQYLESWLNSPRSRAISLSLPTQHLPEQIVEPILSELERKLAEVNR